METVLLEIAVLGAAALVAAAVVTDVASLTIPNRIPVGVVLAFALAAATGTLDAPALGWHLATGAAVFAACIGLFAAGLFGGGDAKLMPAVALWIGPPALTPFVFYTALAGGALALAFLVLRNVPVPAAAAGQPWVARLRKRDAGIPYAVAIAVGAAFAAGNAPLVATAFQ